MLIRYFLYWPLWAALGLPAIACGQATAPTDFKPLLKRLAEDEVDRHGNQLPWLAPPVLHRDSTYASGGKRRELGFELLLGKPLGLAHRVVQLRGHGYPVSYSVVFQGCLVALFKNGKFGCYRLADFTPDEQLEWQLNSGGWERCWLIGSKLVAQNNKGYYAYDPQAHGWQLYEQTVPFGKQPKLYEDARYLTYADCNGEFGGDVYFFNKQTGRTHWANATCANSLWQENGQYRLLVSLGHMMGSTACAAIADPEVLPLVKAPKSTKGLVPAGPPQGETKADWQYSFQASERGVTKLFDFYGVQLFGAWRWHDQTRYLMHWHRTTFLVTIDGKRVTIVDPLFANDLYTHNPVTTSYGPELALTNVDFYGLGGSDEVAALLWQGQQVTKVEWGEQPDEQR